MGTSSGFFSYRNGTRDTSLFPPEKETTSIASKGSDAKERGGYRLHWTMTRGDRAPYAIIASIKCALRWAPSIEIFMLFS